MACYEPHQPLLERRTIVLPGLPSALDGFRIVHLSDLHLRRLGRREARAIELVRQAQPDLILITGDFIQDRAVRNGRTARLPEATAVVEFLHQLSAPHGLYGCWGNWDHPDLAEAFVAAGLRILDRSAVEIHHGGAALWIAGVPWRRGDQRRERQRDMVQALSHVPAGARCILLRHDPTFLQRDLNGRRIDLILSGHCHGGQINFPLLGSLSRFHTPHYAGWHNLGGSQLYVNRGLGVHTLPIRLRCRPEVSLLTLRREEKGAA
jgi:predicted MPP superfamily phosphohydrolase